MASQITVKSTVQANNKETSTPFPRHDVIIYLPGADEAVSVRQM